MSSSWPIVQLGTQLQIKHGFAFKGEHFAEAGEFIVLTPGNFYDKGGFKPKDGAEKFYTAQPPPDYVLHRNDLVVAMTEQSQGLLGSSALIPTDDMYLHNQRIGLVELKPGVDRRFIYYLFNTQLVRDQIQATATGAKVRHTAPSRIEAVNVPLPPLDTQRKIGAILSHYDDLIETNSRRIRLLGEMAQRIYREWFVELRYPEPLSSRIVGSRLGAIPSAWEVMQLGDELELIEAGSRPRGGIDPSEGGVPSVGAENVLGLGRYDYSKEKYIGTAFFESMRRGRVMDGDVLLYKDGAHIGRTSFFGNGFPHAACAINEHVFRLRAERVPQTFLYFWLSSSETTLRVRALNSNAAQPGLNQASLKGLEIVVPPEDLLTAFDRLVSPLVSLALNSALASRQLQLARDLLLPRLFSGELGVEHLNISDGLVAA